MLNLAGRHGISFKTRRSSPAALEAGCARLLSEDLQDGQRIEPLKSVNPFRESKK